MAHKVTPTDIVNFNELYLKLHTYSAVAKETGFSPSTVSKYIDKNYKSIEEKAKIRVVFNQELTPLTIDQIENYDKIRGHWGLTCELTEIEREELKELYAEI